MNLTTYVEECQRTKSDKFYGGNVALRVFVERLNSAIFHLQALDEIKKSLFYNRHFDGLITEGIKLNCNNLQIHNLGETPQASLDVLHAIIGKATEAGELLEALRAAVIDNKPLDRTNLIEEIGDGFWYDAIALFAIGETSSGFEQCAAINNAKLRKRFPDKFSEDRANTRDLFAERQVLEGPPPAYNSESPAR